MWSDNAIFIITKTTIRCEDEDITCKRQQYLPLLKIPDLRARFSVILEPYIYLSTYDVEM